jgi:hypothetical protein
MISTFEMTGCFERRALFGTSFAIEPAMIKDSALNEFRTSLRGQLLLPNQPGFLWPRGSYNYWKSSFLKSFSDGAIDN